MIQNSKSSYEIRSAIIEKIWHGRDPFLGFPKNHYFIDVQGWNSDHPYLIEAIEGMKPRIIVEIGVWKGGSTMTMAKKIKELNLDCVVISVDTWLGSSEHWLNQEWFNDISIVNGYPNLFYKFMANIINLELQNYVLPLPIDSINAAKIFKNNNIEIDVLHLDAGHDYNSVFGDLGAWWPLLRAGGVLIGDDYAPDGGWPEVRQAFDDFFGARGLIPFEHGGNKCRIQKLSPLPEDFDPARYLDLNPDIRVTDPGRHWQEFGCREGRRWK